MSDAQVHDVAVAVLCLTLIIAIVGLWLIRREDRR